MLDRRAGKWLDELANDRMRESFDHAEAVLRQIADSYPWDPYIEGECITDDMAEPTNRRLAREYLASAQAPVALPDSGLPVVERPEEKESAGDGRAVSVEAALRVADSALELQEHDAHCTDFLCLQRDGCPIRMPLFAAHDDAVEEYRILFGSALCEPPSASESLTGYATQVRGRQGQMGESGETRSGGYVTRSDATSAGESVVTSLDHSGPGQKGETSASLSPAATSATRDSGAPQNPSAVSLVDVIRKALEDAEITFVSVVGGCWTLSPDRARRQSDKMREALAALGVLSARHEEAQRLLALILKTNRYQNDRQFFRDALGEAQAFLDDANGVDSGGGT